MGVAGKKRGGSVSVREYHKQVYPGVTYVSLTRVCIAPLERRTWIKFMKDGRWDSGVYNENHVAHTILIPRSFITRIHEAWYKEGHPAAHEWDRVFGGTTQ